MSRRTPTPERRGAPLRIGIDLRRAMTTGPPARAWLGLYAQRQLSEVLRIDRTSHYLLYCREDAEEGSLSPEIRRAPNVSVRTFPAGLTGQVDDSTCLQAAEAYQAWLEREQLDIFHSVVGRNTEHPLVPVFDVCPHVVTVNDAQAPAGDPDGGVDTLMAPIHRLLATGMVARAERLLVTSERVRQEARVQLGIPPSRSRVAWPSVATGFHRLDRRAAIARLGPVRRRIRIPATFGLLPSTAAGDDLDPCLGAYALLPPERRTQCPLIVTGDAGQYPAGESLLVAAGARDDVMFIGAVADDQLAGLLSLATFVLHAPSRDEIGPGVLEAMACGAPSIVCGGAPFTEVTTGAAIGVDAADTRSLTAAMEVLVNDEERRCSLRERGMRRARVVGGETLGRVTLAAFREAAAHRRRRSGARPRVAVWTPVPPQRSGVADYSVELLGALDPFIDVEIFVDDGVMPDAELLTRWRVHHHSAFDRRRRQAPFDLVLYQFGGSSYHTYMYDPLQEHPGLIDLHDLSWSQVLFHEAAISGRPEDFDREVLVQDGENAVAEYRAARRAGDGSLDPVMQGFMDDHPMLRRVVDSSLAQVVHFPEARRVLEESYGSSRVQVIPMGVADPFRSAGRAAARTARSISGVGPGTFVVGVFGIVHPVKCLETCIRAVHQLLSLHPDSLLVVVGRGLDETYVDELAELVRTLGIADQVRFTGHVARTLFDLHLIACDVVVNLRYPAHGQMSAIIMRAAAAATPVIVSEIADWEFIRGDFCRRLAHGDGEVDRLAAQLASLAGDPSLRARLARSARDFHRLEGSLEVMGERYRRSIMELL